MESNLKKLEKLTSVNQTAKDVGHPADPKSPAVPVQVNDEQSGGNLTETDDEKIIHTLESIHYSTEAEPVKNIDENQKAMQKLDKLLKANTITRKKFIKVENGDKPAAVSVVTVKSVSIEKKAPRILNASFAKPSNSENKRLLNNLNKPIHSKQDLLAILEDNPQAEEGEVDVKIIDDPAFGSNKVMTTVLLSKNQELRIAASQIKEISRRPAFPKQNNSVAGVSENLLEPGEIVSSIVSEWSDNEEETSQQSSILNNISKDAKMKNERKKKVPLDSKNVTPAEIINDNQNEEIINLKPAKIEETTGIAPFKRSRVIKKKIIWDPDAPETQFSYASLIKPKAKPAPKKKNVQNKSVDNSVELENETPPKPVTPVRSKQLINNKKRKEVNQEKTNENLEEVLDAILCDENTTVEENGVLKTTELPTKKTTETQETQAKKPRIIKGKQTVLQSSSWDYISKGQTDEMMIIRRRSSSYSSTASHRRMSLEQHQLQQSQTSPQKATKVARKVNALESSKATPAKKRKQEIHLKKVPVSNTTEENKGVNVKLLTNYKAPSAAELKKMAPPEIAFNPVSSTQKKSNRPISTVSDGHVAVTAINTTNNLKSQKSLEKKSTKSTEEKFKSSIEIILSKQESVVNLIFDLKTENPANTFSIEFVKKFISTLDHLKADKTCKVVVVTSKSTHFCQGIDYSSLLAPSVEKRKFLAVEFARYIKFLFETLINFNKPLIAAVNGAVSNLGVTILPLFDFVFASDKCAFEMSYSKIGQIPEGNCILSELNMDKKYKLKLIYLAEKLTANEALSCGLLTAIFPAQKLETEALNVGKKLASLSQQTYKSMKQLRMQKFATEGIVKALEEEQNYLIEHWISNECQDKFKELMQK